MFRLWFYSGLDIFGCAKLSPTTYVISYTQLCFYSLGVKCSFMKISFTVSFLKSFSYFIKQLLLNRTTFISRIQTFNSWYFSSSVGATSDCVFSNSLAPPMQQGQREGSVSPGTEKRNRSISVIAGKKSFNL